MKNRDSERAYKEKCRRANRDEWWARYGMDTPAPNAKTKEERREANRAAWRARYGDSPYS